MQTKYLVLGGMAMLAASAVAIAGPKPAGGTVSGKVTYEGTPAKMKPIDMSKEPSCAKMYPTPPMAETVVTGSGNSLENVVVYVSAGVPDDPAPSTAAVFTQKGCRYIPHVIGVQVGQPVEFTNSDPTMHNIHTTADTPTNPEIDISQPPKGGTTQRVFAHPELMIPVRCNNHPWMNAFINVAPTPFFAVTDAEGKFTISGLPAGDYVLTAVHEKMGEQDIHVTVKPQETAKADYSFSAK